MSAAGCGATVPDMSAPEPGEGTTLVPRSRGLRDAADGVPGNPGRLPGEESSATVVVTGEARAETPAPRGVGGTAARQGETPPPAQGPPAAAAPEDGEQQALESRGAQAQADDAETEPGTVAVAAAEEQQQRGVAAEGKEEEEEGMQVEQKPEEMEMLMEASGGRGRALASGHQSPHEPAGGHPAGTGHCERSGRQGLPTSGAEVWADAATLSGAEELHHSEHPRLLDDRLPEPPPVVGHDQGSGCRDVKVRNQSGGEGTQAPQGRLQIQVLLSEKPLLQEQADRQGVRSEVFGSGGVSFHADHLAERTRAAVLHPQKPEPHLQLLHLVFRPQPSRIRPNR